MAWGKYQNEIFEYATANETSSFAIRAVAGSGKTTTEIECARRIASKNPEQSILFLAFNKSIVEELKQRTQEFPSIRCYTLHSMGLATLAKSKLKINVNDSKYRNYILDNYKKLIDKPLDNDKKKWVYVKNCDELLRLCRINLVKPKDKQRISEIMKHYGISPVANEIDVVSKLLLKAQTLISFRSKKSDGYDIDYTDMICLPLTDSFSKFIFRYDTVFIDEAQDLSVAQQELMLRCVKKTGRFIMAGDPAQNIQGFTGLQSDSFERLEKIAGKTLPLSVNYRCGTNIITEAQKLVPQIEAHEDAIEGIVETTDSLRDAQPGDMILCRKTAPLLELTLRLIANGKSAYIKGRDVADKMISLIDRVESETFAVLTLDMLWDRLEVILKRLTDDLREQGVEFISAHPLYIDMSDKIYALKAIGYHCKDVQQLRDVLVKLFIDTEDGNAIILSTVHKAKGLEADNVYIICPELLPMRIDGQQPWEFQQELNLKYVAVTRAKKRLVWVNVDEKSIKDIKIR